MPPVTCHLRYQIDPSELEAFERFAKRSIALVERSGGQHHGYFLPSGRHKRCRLRLVHVPEPRRLIDFHGRGDGPLRDPVMRALRIDAGALA